MTYLESSTQASGVPLHVTDPATLRAVTQLIKRAN
jgi:hypothetical protein